MKPVIRIRVMRNELQLGNLLVSLQITDYALRIKTPLKKGLSTLLKEGEMG